MSQFRIGQRVKVIAPPQRRGSVMSVAGTGQNAVITVRLDGWHPVSYHPAQLAPA